MKALSVFGVVRLIGTVFVSGIFFCLAPEAGADEEETRPRVTVDAEEEGGDGHDQFTEMGEYGQPAWAERNRASSTTSVYVLSPYEAFFGLNWEGKFLRRGKSGHALTQEIDVGLLHRFEIGIENEIGLTGADGQEASLTLEARYALADWNKLPLNPAISVEYLFGIGKEARRGDSSHDKNDLSDAVALRLLLGQALFDNRVGYGLNVTLQQDVTSDSGRQFQISQSITCGWMKGRFETGLDLCYTHSTGQTARGHLDELVIGPTFGWKPTRQTRLTIAPLAGCTSESPAVAAFVQFSYELGGAEAIVPTTPMGGH